MGKNDWEIYFASLKKQDWQTAKTALLKLSTEDKNNPQIHLKIGDVYQRTGDTQNAIASYLLAGRILEYHGFSQKALAAFKIILRLDPNNREVIARAQMIMDNIESAKSARVKPSGFTEEAAVSSIAKEPAAEKPLPMPPPAPPAGSPEAPSQPSDWLESTSLADKPESEKLHASLSSKAEPPSEDAYPPVSDKAAADEEEEWLKSAFEAIDKSVHPGKTEEMPPEMADLVRPLSERPGPPLKPELFSALPDDVFSKFISELDVRSFPDGRVVIEEGDSGDTMYLIRNGNAQVVAHLLGREIELAILGEGDLFGEVGFLTGRPRTASVIAKGNLEVFEINRLNTEMLIDMNPEVLAKLEEFYEGRVIDTIKKIKP